MSATGSESQEPARATRNSRAQLCDANRTIVNERGSVREYVSPLAL